MSHCMQCDMAVPGSYVTFMSHCMQCDMARPVGYVSKNEFQQILFANSYRNGLEQMSSTKYFLETLTVCVGKSMFIYGFNTLLG